jgi:hypothetical protein
MRLPPLESFVVALRMVEMGASTARWLCMCSGQGGGCVCECSSAVHAVPDVHKLDESDCEASRMSRLLCGKNSSESLASSAVTTSGVAPVVRGKQGQGAKG